MTITFNDEAPSIAQCPMNNGGSISVRPTGFGASCPTTSLSDAFDGKPATGTISARLVDSDIGDGNFQSFQGIDLSFTLNCDDLIVFFPPSGASPNFGTCSSVSVTYPTPQPTTAAPSGLPSHNPTLSPSNFPTDSPSVTPGKRTKNDVAGGKSKKSKKTKSPSSSS